MCLNEKLRFSIKVKSRSCELFVLKKNDFLRLSVNFKEFIESFLQKSLMIYLKYNEERKKLIAEEEAMMDKIHKKSKPKAEKNDEKSNNSPSNKERNTGNRQRNNSVDKGNVNSQHGRWALRFNLGCKDIGFRTIYGDVSCTNACRSVILSCDSLRFDFCD